MGQVTAARRRGELELAAVFYLLHGEDELSRSEALRELRSRMGDADMAELNTTYLDGTRIDLSELQHTCNTIPFFADRRLVVVQGLLTHLQQNVANDHRKQWVQSLVDYLPRMPDTTRLVFVEPAAISPRHPLRVLAARNQELGFDREYPLPQGAELLQWIARRVEEHGGSIAPDAIHQLAAFIGDNLRLLAQEIDKLLAYVGQARPVTSEDIELMVSDVREANVFDMVDALGQRDQHQASQLLHQLLDGGHHPLALEGMMVRQIRILIEVKELDGEGLGRTAIARQLGLHPFVVRKALAQQRNFTMAQLESIQRQLLDADVAIKTGQTDPVLALDMLMAGLAES